MESLVCLAWSLVLVRFCGQDSVTFGAALPPFTRTVPMRIDAATRAAEVAARETYELFNQIRNLLPTWGALLPEGDPGAAYSLSALFGYGLPEEHEDIRVHVINADAAIALLYSGGINNAITIIALQWLQTQRDRLRRQWC